MWSLVDPQADGKPGFFGTLHNHPFPVRVKSQYAPW
jgi:hypothetical protein